MVVMGFVVVWRRPLESWTGRFSGKIGSEMCGGIIETDIGDGRLHSEAIKSDQI